MSENSREISALAIGLIVYDGPAPHTGYVYITLRRRDAVVGDPLEKGDAQ